MKEYIPKWNILLAQNTFSAFLIALAFTITTNYLPILYKQVKVNSGVISLFSEDPQWSQLITISATNNDIEFKVCDIQHHANNNMYDFYNALNNSLLACSLPKDLPVNIKIVTNPFKELNRISSNSIIRRHFFEN